jgi:hypothetical protein
VCDQSCEKSETGENPSTKPAPALRQEERRAAELRRDHGCRNEAGGLRPSATASACAPFKSRSLAMPLIRKGAARARRAAI